MWKVSKQKKKKKKTEPKTLLLVVTAHFVFDNFFLVGRDAAKNKTWAYVKKIPSKYFKDEKPKK